MDKKLQKVRIQRPTKWECWKAIDELEKRGFECLMPIKEVYKNGKSWINIKESGRKKSIFNGNQQEVYYITIMGRTV